MDDAEAQQVEEHARACRPCEALLATEARADALLTQAVALTPPARPSRVKSFVTVAVPLALAASLLLVALGGPATPAQVPDGGISVNVPRYELDDEVPREALSALEPAGL